MTTIQSQGSTLTVESGASPATQLTIGQIVNIDGPSGSAPVIDVSNLLSTRREKNMGLPDEGQITLSVQFDPDDTGQTRVKALRDGRLLGSFIISLPDSPATTWTFSGYVLEFSKSIQIDQVVMGNITIEVTGAVTEA